MNAIFREDRTLPPVELLMQIWGKTMAKRFRIRQLIDKSVVPGRVYTPCVAKWFRLERAAANSFTAQPSEVWSGAAQDRLSQETFPVNIDEENGRVYACKCGQFQTVQLPCRHAIAYILEFTNWRLDKFAQDWRRMPAWRGTYTQNLPPINFSLVEQTALLEDLVFTEEDPEVVAPIEVVPVLGRRRTLRMEAGLVQRRGQNPPGQHRRVNHCSECGQAGHKKSNRARCPLFRYRPYDA
ncbi:hypothetical protein BJ508DRAFT_419161 [Ascobolus immersus RN42]|uniref:SWIM-type domain-containing protein n=1 Tax=Ascobolus immersus RN42 TaxID=1160509 RepID=A0A3N4HGB2_ASCIM|nr:hypothetical protein BJ508DRAFT_419161 [Ascobolus immersus RN42]